MESQSSYNRRHREHLNEQWETKWPSGMFVLQRTEQPKIILQTGRNTSWLSHGLSVKLNADGTMTTGGGRSVRIKRTAYNSLNKLLSACRKYKVNEELVSTFVQMCERREERLARQAYCVQTDASNKTGNCFCDYLPHMNKCKKCGRSCGCYTKKEL